MLTRVMYLVLISQVRSCRAKQRGGSSEFCRATRQPGNQLHVLFRPRRPELRDTGRGDSRHRHPLHVLAAVITRRRPLDRSRLCFPRRHERQSP